MKTQTALVTLAVLVTVVAAASALGLGSSSSGPPLPTVVSIAYSADANGHLIFRQWSDGRLDVLSINGSVNICNDPPLNCVGQLLEGTTSYADVDRDGVVGVTDFLAVLAEWDS